MLSVETAPPDNADDGGVTTHFERSTSIARVDFDFAEDGRHLSIPVVNIEAAPQGTNYFSYEDGYDSNNEISPFWDAVGRSLYR